MAGHRYEICRVDELPPGSRKIVEIRGRSIGILNVKGVYYAVRNKCPHKGAPLCEGTVGGTFIPSEPHEYVYGLEARILRCPWHGWEFDLATGRSLFDSARVRVKLYRVTVQDGLVILHA